MQTINKITLKTKPVTFSVFDDGTLEMGFLPIGTQITREGVVRTVTENVFTTINFAPEPAIA